MSTAETRYFLKNLFLHGFQCVPDNNIDMVAKQLGTFKPLDTRDRSLKVGIDIGRTATIIIEDKYQTEGGHISIENLLKEMFE